MRKASFLVAALLGLAAAAPTVATAGPLVLSLGGNFNATTTLGGVALGAEAAFTMTAAFDSTSGIPIVTGFNLFPTASVVFEIDGFGTFTTAFGLDFYVLVQDPDIGAPGYGVGLITADLGQAYGSTFTSATPAFSGAAPAPTVFSGSQGVFAQLPFTIELAGGAGDLVIRDYPQDLTSTASIVAGAAVPEPASLTLAGLALAGAGASGLRRKSASTR